MGVKGTLQDMSLTGLISINCNEGNQAALHVRKGDQEAHIYFDSGQIAHIMMGDRVGEGVIRDLLMWEEGEFELDLNVPPPAHTIHIPWFNLVLDHMRVMDENGTEEFFDGGSSGAGGESGVGALSYGESESVQQDYGLVDGFGLFEDIAEPDIEALDQEVRDMAELRDLLKEMSGEIQGFVAAAVSGVDGLSIAEYSASPDFNMEVATAQFALVMKLVQKNTVRLKSGTVEDNLVTTDTSYILSRFLGDEASYYLVVAVDRDMASLGNARLMTRNFAQDLWASIPRRR